MRSGTYVDCVRLTLAIAVLQGAAGCLSPTARSAADVYARAKAASVDILVAGRQEGSGWFADGHGLVVTASHVVRASTNNVEVLWAEGGQRLPASVVAIDRGHDIALLKVPDGARPFPALAVADAMPKPGETVFVFGTALFRHDVLLSGTVASRGATFNYFETPPMAVRCYYVSAPSPPGTSGGPWVDGEGRVVGNQSGFVTHEKAGAGIAVVAPPDAIRRLVATRASAQTPSLGCGLEELWSQSPGFIARLPRGTEGLITIPIEPGGAAEKAGLNRESCIVAIEGTPVRYRDAAYRLIRTHKPGDELLLSVRNPEDKEPRQVKVTLGRME